MMMGVGRSILLLCVLALIASAHLTYAHERNEPQSQLQPQKCSKLLTRKEWRTLTYGEKAEWVGAVKVLPSFLPLARTLLMSSSAWQAYDTNGYP